MTAAGDAVPKLARTLYGLPLTEREREILRLLPGRSNAEVGRELFVAANTVKTRLQRVMAKLGAKDRAHAVLIAAAHGVYADVRIVGVPSNLPVSARHMVWCPALRVPACTCRGGRAAVGGVGR